MATTPSDSAAPAHKWVPLSANQRRVLGVLIEKAKTTPGSYPMTVNAVVAGSNQKNNRDPLTSLDDFDVEKALSELRDLGVVQELDWMGRVPKYKHVAYEWLGVNKAELAVLAELLLRGAQTLGELRARAARMEAIADLDALRPIVAGLIERGLMIELTPPGRGQVVTHHLYEPHELAELRALQGDAARNPRGPSPSPGGATPGAPTREPHDRPDPTHELHHVVEGLRAEIQRLRERIERLEGLIERS